MKKQLIAWLLVLLLLLSGCSVYETTMEIMEQMPEEELEELPELPPEEGTAVEEAEEAPAEEEPAAEETWEVVMPEDEESTSADTVPDESDSFYIDEEGSYTYCEDVALYIYTYGELPDNFITKAEARELGWSGGSLEDYAPGMCIGGDRFGNREGLLPDAPGRTWTECDIGTLDANGRGAHRLVFSNDGLIYCTEDHYESFELLYGEP